ncbi:5737_t:CDS:2 [Rhizophagus irregularis]|nr:5737_t:CDS:2 [Rhizophagus irregularis]
MIITLFCLIEGNLPADNYAFPIDISQELSVGVLKQKIRESKPNDLANIDFNNITLWQVDLPDDNDDVIHEFRSHKSTKKMRATRKIGFYWPETPSEQVIHVIIELPRVPSHTSIDDELTTNFRRLNIAMGKELTTEDTSYEGADAFAFISEERLGFIDQALTRGRVVLLRSPPSSGKTTLAYILKKYRQNLNPEEEVIAISMLLLERPEVSLSDPDLFDQRGPNDIPYAKFFWNTIKAIMNSSRASNNAPVRILLLSMYGMPKPLDGISTPITFSVTLGLDHLRLSRAEYSVLLEKFITATQREMHFEIEGNIKNVMYNMSRGHAGIMRGTLNRVKEQYRNGVQTTPELLKYFISADFRNFLTSTRSFIWLRDWNPSNKESRFLRNALNSVPYDKRYHLLDDGSFEEFLLRSLERMRSSVLKSSLSKASDKFDSRLVEQMWQNEWYRSANTVLPDDVTISSNVGGLYGTNAYLDFYVNGELQWGVEILREGTDMSEHAARFGPNGRYNTIPFNEIAVIDFRYITKKLINPLKHFWHVFYTDDYTKFIVMRLGKPDEHLVLRGDLD